VKSTEDSNSNPTAQNSQRRPRKAHRAVMATAAAAITVSGLGIAPPASAQSAGTETSSSSSVQTLSASDWRYIADRAASDGDKSGARAAETMASRVEAKSAGDKSVPKRVETQNVVTAMAKKAVIAALKHGGSKLPKKLRPYSSKLLTFFENLETWQEGPIVAGLLQIGIPYDVAQYAATWVVTFAGV
jgi:hypothetical protein